MRPQATRLEQVPYSNNVLKKHTHNANRNKNIIFVAVFFIGLAIVLFALNNRGSEPKSLKNPTLIADAATTTAPSTEDAPMSKNLASSQDAIVIHKNSTPLKTPIQSPIDSNTLVDDDNTALNSIKETADNTVATTETTSEESLTLTTVTIVAGDNLSKVFNRAGVSLNEVYTISQKTEHGKSISRLIPGRSFDFYKNDANQLASLDYHINKLERFHVARDEQDIFVSQHIKRTPEAVPSVKSGLITSSFYKAGLNAGLSDNHIMGLTDIFGWDIDFALEIRDGDSFTVIHEKLYLDGEYIGPGTILAAEFNNQGRKVRALRYVDKDGKANYYTPEGNSLRKAFIRTPLDVFRVSSHFNLKRKHPVLNRIRAHKGVDYAAPSGTPVRAAGDGKVIFAGVNGGYGNMIKLQHGKTYQTRYAHLKKYAKGIRSGKYVKQGQIIGYVGSSGLATGPHLHYEFYVNGSVRNPVTVKLPNGSPIAKTEKETFLAQTASVLALLNHSSETYALSTIKELPSS